MDFRHHLRHNFPGLYRVLAHYYQNTPLYHRALKQQEARRRRRETRLIADVFGNDTTVRAGPFRGMRYLSEAHGSRILPKLAGCYESPLHHWMEDAVRRDYPTILDIGCAEGYYAVGLALRCPKAQVHAFDTSAAARDLCRQLAEQNGVEDRILIHGECTAHDFERWAEGRSLIVCDIEGAERHLLNPRTAPALAHCDLIVEMHDCLLPGLTPELTARFTTTHQVECVTDREVNWRQHDVLRNLPESVRSEILDEFRPPGMQWMRMIARRNLSEANG